MLHSPFLFIMKYQSIIHSLRNNSTQSSSNLQSRCIPVIPTQRHRTPTPSLPLSIYSPPPFSPSPQSSHHAFGGALTRSGTSGFTSVTTLKRSSTTLSPVLFPASLIVFSCSSASLLASSSAFLLPLVCCRQTLYVSHSLRRYGWDGSAGEGCRTYLLLKLLKLIIFLLSVFFYFFLGFVFGVFDALRAVCGGMFRQESCKDEVETVHSRADRC